MLEAGGADLLNVSLSLGGSSVATFVLVIARLMALQSIMKLGTSLVRARDCWLLCSGLSENKLMMMFRGSLLALSAKKGLDIYYVILYIHN